MSSRTTENIYYKIFKNPYEILSEKEIDLTIIVTPLSKIFGSVESTDIYSGLEKIPFRERDPEYRMILRQEFANTLKSDF
ncbi:MAG: hypothetical protein ACXAEX_00555 [Promethearchaeota archaeon]|jgi:hypothetical protein